MTTNVDPHELQKFSELAYRWWDANAEFKPLHDLNPVRLDWIDNHAHLSGKRVLDIGCGGGILSESMAVRGATVKGIDLSTNALGGADLHSLESGVEVAYEEIAAEAIAARQRQLLGGQMPHHLGQRAESQERREHQFDPRLHFAVRSRDKC